MRFPNLCWHIRKVAILLAALASMLPAPTPAFAQAGGAVYLGPVSSEPDGFNARWYLQQYPDVAANWHADYREHWLRNGKREGRKAFDPAAIAPATAVKPAGKALVGINIGGYEVNGGMRDAKPNWHYAVPPAATFAYFAAKGLPATRLPVAWERLQPVALGPLDPAQVTILLGIVEDARRAGCTVLIDLHNYGRYDGQLATPAMVADLWRRLAAALKGKVAGYGIMNEPHDMGDGTLWPRQAQAAVDAIRPIDMDTAIYVAADSWSSVNATIVKVNDPANRIFYEGHIYYDVAGSGQYGTAGYKAQTAASLVAQVADFARRARAAGGEPFIGETGAPADAASLVLIDAVLQAANDNAVPVAYWLAGPWSLADPSSVQPANDTDKPQMRLLTKAR